MANYTIKLAFQSRVKVIIVNAVKRKHVNQMMARQLPEDVVAANLSTGIRWDESASFYPKNSHRLPADSTICGPNIDAACRF